VGHGKAKAGKQHTGSKDRKGKKDQHQGHNDRNGRKDHKKGSPDTTAGSGDAARDIPAPHTGGRQ